ncbi:DNA cytosine methyltransferase [Haloferula sp. A504]|uniref:DNA cytosine methyltransferase n=1 Tax=Haloferula sp. A504 TaxID=3373601 RepID=UPI0031C057A9|nr:DNA cytosine methyltransferase [Verrucomicrobiaceae bacterium E54]
MPRRTLISLFSGAGGLDLGLEAAGFDTKVAVEFDAACVETLRQNRDWPVIHSDIHAVTNQALLKTAGLREGEADLLAGGPPCQPFSKSGYWASGDAKRLRDPRATTLDAYLRILEAAKPKAFLLENVSGLAYRGKSEGLDYLLRSIDAINNRTGLNYGVEVLQLNAAHFGVPQIRERVFLVGSREGESFGSLAATHQLPDDSQCDALLDSAFTAWDAIGDLEDDDSPDLAVKGKWADLLPSIPEGMNYLHHTDRGEGLPLFGWRRRFWNFLLKLSKDKPSWTLTAQPGPATGPFHWKNRHLSSQELARLQTFPRDYQILGNRVVAQKQVGNAVPSALAEKLGQELRSRFLGDTLRSGGALTLLPKRSSKRAHPEPVKRVPRKYYELKGDHEAHPGTGLGYGAVQRMKSA